MRCPVFLEIATPQQRRERDTQKIQHHGSACGRGSTRMHRIPGIGWGDQYVCGLLRTRTLLVAMQPCPAPGRRIPAGWQWLSARFVTGCLTVSYQVSRADRRSPSTVLHIPPLRPSIPVETSLSSIYSGGETASVKTPRQHVSKAAAEPRHPVNVSAPQDAEVR